MTSVARNGARWRLLPLLTAALLLPGALTSQATTAAEAVQRRGTGLIAFVGDAQGYGIYTVKPDGTQLRKIRPLSDGPGDNSAPVWSPNGKWLAFDDADDLVVMDRRGHRARVVLPSSGYYSRVSSWSPDGTRLALSRGDHNLPDRDIYSVKLDGSGLTNITSSPTVDDFGPKWSPDGSQIAFTAYDHRPWSRNNSTSDLWVMRADGSRQRKLTPRTWDSFEGPADWSPDGQRLLWGSSTSPDVLVMNRRGGGRQALPSGAGTDGMATWSPDGRRIAFVSDRSGGMEIYLMRRDGSGVFRITDGAAVISGLDWSRR